MPRLEGIKGRTYPYRNDPQPPKQDRFSLRAFVADGRVLFELTRATTPNGDTADDPTDAPLSPRVMDALVMAWLRYRVGAQN